ncbi:MAG: hypothetical protein P8I82_07050 [Flavobacteriales bacterium]|nr:hypothetical protein [Flavobacteriales bacterium]
MNIPSQLIEVLDIAMAGFRKENESFVISILHKDEELLQIINRNMTEECRAENGAFGIVLAVCFDVNEDKDALDRFTHSHFKFESTPARDINEELAYYFLPLESGSEKSAKTICKLLEKIFLIKSTQHLDFEVYEVEA